MRTDRSSLLIDIFSWHGSCVCTSIDLTHTGCDKYDLGYAPFAIRNIVEMRLTCKLQGIQCRMVLVVNFLCFSFLAHLSQRLIGELIGYPWSGVRPSVVVRSQCSKIFFSKTAWPIKAKFYVEPPWVGGTIFCSRHLGHMTKMAATPIYGKNPSKIFFSRTGRPIFTKLGM